MEPTELKGQELSWLGGGQRAGGARAGSTMPMGPYGCYRVGGVQHEAPAAPTRSLQMLWALLQGPLAGSFA